MAGSETTATALSAATFYLTTNQHALSTLAREVRSSFQDEDDIDILSVQKLPYLLAVLNEAMRMYPPVPTALPRRVPAGGDVIIGHFVPENVSQPPREK